eukprot:TRINITY_DN3215_c0_g1_i4.p1 TRINITY_DN3215_c0_g1~~TRINITY_DN3215_c0_g1_i4.p1  ORF type:complete len:126 (+),score=17.10 TRINITY_DN3215_c0_g1_i4:79-456(+)
MRSKSASLTDVIVLVVAADEGVLPQTIEAISHIKKNKVPLVVAITKCDKDSANPQRVMKQLATHNIVVEDLGGEVQCVEVSAPTGKGVDDLLEAITLQAGILDLKADPLHPSPTAVTIESPRTLR